MAPTAQKTERTGKRTSSEVFPAAANGHEANGNGVREAGTAMAAAILEAADPNTGEHSDDVELVVEELCRRLAVNGTLREDILVAARLHDVGKVAVPRDVLEKPGALDEDEWELVKQHTLTGERILRSIPELVPVAVLVRHSHEHFDGTGYPDGLSGEEIPLGSRIILCADAFHAIRSDRPYRKGRPTALALKEMKRYSGSQFDPDVVAALTASVDGARRTRRRTLPPRLAILFACSAIGSGGAFAAEKGWIPSPIPGWGSDSKAEESASGSPKTTSDTVPLDQRSAGDASAGGEGSSGDATKDGGGDTATTPSVNAAIRDGKGPGRLSPGAPFGSTAGGSAQGQGAGEGGSQANDGFGDPGDSGGDSSGAGVSNHGGDAGGGSAGGSADGGGTGGGSSGGGSSESPGNSGNAPGQTGSSPGQSGGNPGGGAPPGQSGTSPGQSGSTPGQSGSTPGQSGSTPGQSGSTLGQPGTAPGNSGSAPGQTGSPGNSGSAPGQTTAGNSGNAPGQGGGGNPHG